MSAVSAPAGGSETTTEVSTVSDTWWSTSTGASAAASTTGLGGLTVPRASKKPVTHSVESTASMSGACMSASHSALTARSAAGRASSTASMAAMAAMARFFLIRQFSAAKASSVLALPFAKSATQLSFLPGRRTMVSRVGIDTECVSRVTRSSSHTSTTRMDLGAPSAVHEKLRARVASRRPLKYAAGGAGGVMATATEDIGGDAFPGLLKPFMPPGAL